MIYFIFKFYQENKELFSSIEELIRIIAFSVFIFKFIYGRFLNKKNRNAILEFEYKNKQSFIDFFKIKPYLKAQIKDRYIFIILYMIVGLANMYLIINYLENPRIYLDCSYIIALIISYIKARDDERYYIKFIK